jgi:hypothetical protein
LIELIHALGDIISTEVQDRLVRSQELAHEARIIANAWEQQDFEALIALNVLTPDQVDVARALRGVILERGPGLESSSST